MLTAIERILREDTIGHSEYFVVAHVEGVAPILLGANSCSGQDCSALELRSDLRYPARRISGRVSLVEQVQ